MSRKKPTVDDTPVVIKKSAATKSAPVQPMLALDPSVLDMASTNQTDAPKEEPTVLEEIAKSLQAYNKQEATKVHRMAFEVDPASGESNAFAGMYRQKTRLVPDQVIKNITGPMGDDLLCAIIQARSNHISAFGRPRSDRFSNGFQLDPIEKDLVNREDYETIKAEVEEIKDILWNCGFRGLVEESSPNLSQFLKNIVRDGIRFGRFAVEFMWVRDANTGERKFHSFRPVDAGTIYKLLPRAKQDQSLRRNAIRLLEQLKNIKIDAKKLDNDEYKYIQVVNGVPIQVFTDQELVVYNLYPVTDIEYDGYPLTPIDQALNAIITHINITLHNKLYFQNGRAAKGMVVVKSDNVDAATIHAIRNQFTQSINSVRNAWRMPVFGVGADDDISWQTVDASGRDAEFQYLLDQNARTILSAFQMSPDELPGYGHLSRGTNSQGLSECLDFSTTIITKDLGIISVYDLLKGKQSTDVDIWTGLNWNKAKVFRTGIKQLTETTLEGGLSIKTSPDHYFRTINEFGEIDWKPQSQLKPNDVVLTNKQDVIGQSTLIPEYKGKPITPEICEFLGWITGDGCIVGPRPRIGAQISAFYHHDKDANVQHRHIQFLSEFGLNLREKNKERTIEEQEKIKARYNFKSVASLQRISKLYDTDFVNWLFSVGFRSSSEGKNIPGFVFSLPEKHRAAFLRGLFSADGGLSHYDWPVLTTSSDSLRSEVLNLLMTLGIRVRSSQGTTEEMFVNGTERETVETKNKLYIRDRAAFFEKIGFLQPHKQPSIKTLSKNDIEYIPQQLQYKYAQILIEARESGLKVDKDDIFSLKSEKISCTLDRLSKIVQKYNICLPDWMSQYHFVKVLNTVNLDESVEMADVTVYNDDHSFVANGIIVHNSNNEYKLTAARDVGLRPLLNDIQDFFNTHVIPRISQKVSDLFYFTLAGLEKEDPEKESTRIAQDMALHMTYNEILERVEKETIPPEAGGKMPLNQQWLGQVTPFMTVGQFMEYFYGVEGASKDPRYNYIRDPFWFQFQQLNIQKAQIAMQQMMMQQQQQMAMMQAQGQMAPPPEDEAPPPGMEKAELEQFESLKKAKIDAWMKESYDMLVKSNTDNHDKISRAILKRHKDMVDNHLKEFEKDSEDAVKKILAQMEEDED